MILSRDISIPNNYWNVMCIDKNSDLHFPFVHEARSSEEKDKRIPCMRHTHISRTLLSCSSFPCFSSISGSASLCSISLSSDRAMSRISCSCLGRFSFTWPSLFPPYFSNISKNLVRGYNLLMLDPMIL